MLRNRGIRNMVLMGVTTDVCVHTTMRDANDLGYECLILADCCAATDPANHAAALDMVKKQVRDTIMAWRAALSASRLTTCWTAKKLWAAFCAGRRVWVCVNLR